MSTLAANSQRERAVAALRHHFLQGRLTAEELAERCEQALQARTTAELRHALRGLPRIGEAIEQVRTHVGLVVSIGLIAAVWGLLSLVLLTAMVVAAIVGSGSALLAFPLVWLALTIWAVFASRSAIRRHRRRAP